MPDLVYRFAEFELDRARFELRGNGQVLKLGRIPMELLILLAERDGNVVTRQEIIQRLWGEKVFVDTEHGINTAIRKIRQVLKDDSEQPRFVGTVTGKGYRFVGEKRNGSSRSVAGTLPETPPGATSPVPATESEPTKGTLRWVVATGTAIVVLAVSVSAWWFSSRKRTVLTDKDTIVLADFTNTTGDGVFDDSLRQGLSAQLQQSPFLSIVSDQQIQQTLQMMGRKTNVRLTPEITTEVCQRVDGTAAIEGSIAQIGMTYGLILKAVNCANGELLTSTEARAGDKNHVLDALGKAASDIRNKLGESLGSVQRFDTPLVQVTTSSLEALKAFSVYARGGGLISPLPVLLHVLELDPNFAGAHDQLSDVYSGMGETELASEHAQKAFDLRDRVSERERLWIMATYYFAVLGDLDQGLRIYPVIEQSYPRDWGAWNDSACDRLILGDYTRAEEEAREALRRNPAAVNPYLNLGSALLSLNRTDEAQQLLRQALTRGLDVPDVHLLLHRVAFLEGDAKEMDAQLAPLLSIGSIDALVAQSSTEAYLGRLRNSSRFLDQGREIARKGNYNELTAQILDAEALRQAEFGNADAGRRAAVAALTLSPGRNGKLLTALALARTGDLTRAQSLVDGLNQRFPSDTMLQRYWLPTIRGAIELARRRPLRALDGLQSVSYELGDTTLLVGNLYPVYIRAQAYLSAHQGEKAADDFQRLLNHRSIVLNSPLAALAHLGLARAYLLQDDKVRARGAYQDFLALWKNADPEIPVLKEAKTEYAKLQ